MRRESELDAIGRTMFERGLVGTQYVADGSRSGRVTAAPCRPSRPEVRIPPTIRQERRILLGRAYTLGVMHELSPLEASDIRYRQVVLALMKCYDPELPANIYELGLIYDIRITEDDRLTVVMTFTSANCPVAESFPSLVKKVLTQLPWVADVTVEVTFEPPWEPSMMTEGAKLACGFM